MQNIIEDGFHNYFQQQIVWLFFQLTRKDDIKTNYETNTSNIITKPSGLITETKLPG